MKIGVKLVASLVGIGLCGNVAISAESSRESSKQEHVVPLQELNADAARPTETRRANEAAVRHLLSSQAGQQALQSANVDYQRVDKAIGQLSDEDLAKLAERSRKAESDFAAGFLSPKHLAELILVIVVVVVIIVIV
jgi:hypothetical protein